jgi:hypothetical protein
MTTDTTSSLTTLELVGDAIDVLNDGDVILGGAEIDYAAAALLNALVDIIDLDATLPQVREFARLVIEGWPL